MSQPVSQSASEFSMVGEYDSAASWRILAFCFSLQVLCGGMITYLISVANDDFSRSLGIDKVTVLLFTSSSFYFSCAIFSFLLGLVSHRLSRRVSLIISILLVGLGFLTVAIAQEGWHMALAFGVLLSLGFANVQLTTNAVVVAWFSRWRGSALAILAMGISVSGMLLAPFYAAVASNYGWRVVTVILAVAASLLIIPGALLKVDRGVDPAVPRHHATAGGLGWRWRMKSPPLWAMVLSGGLSSMASMAILANLRKIAGEVGIEPLAVAGLFAGLSGSAIIGKLFFMVFNRRMTQRQIGAVPLAAVAFGMMAMALANGFTQVLLGVAALGFAFGIAIPGTMAVLSANFDEADFMPATGLCMMMSTLGIVVGPPALAAIHQQTGAFPPILMVAAGILALLLIPATRMLPAHAYCTPRPETNHLRPSLESP